MPGAAACSHSGTESGTGPAGGRSAGPVPGAPARVLAGLAAGLVTLLAAPAPAATASGFAPHRSVQAGVALPSAPAQRAAGSTGAGVDGAATDGVDSAAARSAAARAAADAVARRVRALTATYRTLSAQAAEAAAALAEAFDAGAAAEQAEDEAERRLRQADARRNAGARALYVEGSAGFVLTVLDSGSVDEALWRLSTAERITDDVLGSLSRRAQVAGADVSRAVAAVEASRAAHEQLAAGLARLQDRAAAADDALAAAKAELNRLTKAARRLEAAEEAARDLAAAQAAAEAARLAAAGPVGALAIPAAYESAYRGAAGTCPGLRWTLLAAVGQVESGHGRNNGPSSAGAIGPMQFMPATFAMYGVDGDGDGRADAWNFRDAIPSAAKYLCATGASGGTDEGVHRALLAYNHAEWYVDLVLGAERSILAAVARATAAPATS